MVRKLFPINENEALNFKLPGVLKVQFQKATEREGSTPSEVLRKFVERYVKLKGNEGGLHVVPFDKE